MLPHPLFRLHAYLRDMRKHVPNAGRLAGRYERIKSYDRMDTIALPRHSPHLHVTDSFTHRSSATLFGKEPIALPDLGGALDLALAVHNDHRPYPSGGSLYPVESYLILRTVTGLNGGVYHYRPDTHELDFLWTLPEVSISELVNDEIARHASALLIFTSVWARSSHKYGEFSLELALMEAGHAAQNVILAAHAHGISSRPFCSFKDDILSKMLDLEMGREQVLYSLALGSPVT